MSRNYYIIYFRSLDGSIQNIQVDSQLAYSQSPVILYLSPTSKSDESRHMPAIHFTSHKSSGPSATTDNAEIFKHLVIIYFNNDAHLCSFPKVTIRYVFTMELKN